MVKWGAGDYVHQIERHCYAGAYKIKDQDYDVWLADEFDYMLTPEYVKFAQNNTFKHKILVSATLEGHKRELAEQIAPIVFEKKTWEIEADGVINKTDHFMVNFQLTPQENYLYAQYQKLFEKYMADPDKYTKSIDWLTRERKMFLGTLGSARAVCQSLIRYLHNSVPDTRALVFANYAAQIDSIMPWTFHTENEKAGWMEKFTNGEINFLGVVGKVDRGINFNGVNTIVYESMFASETKMTQKSGRGKRLQQDLMLRAYYLIPYWQDESKLKPTVALKWFNKATRNIDTTHLSNFVIPCPTTKTFT